MLHERIGGQEEEEDDVRFAERFAEKRDVLCVLSEQEAQLFVCIAARSSADGQLENELVRQGRDRLSHGGLG